MKGAADRWFLSRSDAHTSKRTPTDDRNVENRIEVSHNGKKEAILPRFSKAISSDRTQNGNDGADRCLKSQQKCLWSHINAGWMDGGWLNRLLVGSLPPDISTFDCRCNELIRPLTNWRLRCHWRLERRMGGSHKIKDTMRA